MQRVSACDQTRALPVITHMRPQPRRWAVSQAPGGAGGPFENGAAESFRSCPERRSLLAVSRDGNAAMTERVEPAHADSRSPAAPEGVPVLLLDDNLTVLEALQEAVAADETLTVVGAVCRISDAIRVAAPGLRSSTSTCPMVAVGRPHAGCGESVQTSGSLHTLGSATDSWSARSRQRESRPSSPRALISRSCLQLSMEGISGHRPEIRRHCWAGLTPSRADPGGLGLVRSAPSCLEACQTARAGSAVVEPSYQVDQLRGVRSSALADGDGLVA